jgi:hypothetical protein
MPKPDAKQQRITYTDRVKTIDEFMSMKIEVKYNKTMICKWYQYLLQINKLRYTNNLTN